jgi:hypothetical protein
VLAVGGLKADFTGHSSKGRDTLDPVSVLVPQTQACHPESHLGAIDRVVFTGLSGRPDFSLERIPEELRRVQRSAGGPKHDRQEM